ncbi:MAG: COX15/CtaA family protein [Isosphaeraceae bacterium]|nr:COX15/CtaA family protein [Isosphaeraceae bacterium]
MNPLHPPPETPTDAHSGLGYRPGPHRVALFAAIFTWPLLLVGGTVTVFRVGMAVPDWPTTFGINMFLYRFWSASWGVFIEHGHRLYGSAVGLACIVLAGWFAVAERRPWMKGLGAFALIAVIAQGFLGGYRVRYNSTNLAFIHGCSAQAFFALMVTLCVLTGRDWACAPKGRPDPARLRRRAAVTLALISAQIVAGAWLRHYGSTEALITHALLATAVGGHALLLAGMVERNRATISELVPSARALGLAVLLQVVLGVAAWWVLRPFDGIPRAVTSPQALIRIGHQGVGALLLASAVVLTLKAFRMLTSVARAEEAGPALTSSSLRDLEAVA